MKLFSEKIDMLFAKQDAMVRNYIFSLSKDIVLDTDTEKLALLTAAKFIIDPDLLLIPDQRVKVVRKFDPDKHKVPFRKKSVIRETPFNAVIDYFVPWQGNKKLWNYRPHDDVQYSFEATLSAGMVKFTVLASLPEKKIGNTAWELIEKAADNYIHLLELITGLLKTECKAYNGGLFKFCLTTLEDRLRDFEPAEKSRHLHLL